MSPGDPAAVASTDVPVWTEPKTVPTSSCATQSTTSAGVTIRPSASVARDVAACVTVAVSCSANHVPKTARAAAASARAAVGFATETPRPMSAGPSTKDASSAAPS